MNNIPTRRERRAAMKQHGVLKTKSKLPLNQWVDFTKETAKQGNQIFNTNKDSLEKSITEQHEEIELRMIESWKDAGYNDIEIEKLRTAYATLSIKNIPTRHADKKNARNLIKEVNESKAKRLNG
jgi:L-lactate utilization protein LutC